MENADKKNALYESHITYIPRQLMFITGKTSDTNDFIHYIDAVILQLFLTEEHGCISQEVNDSNDAKEANSFKHILP